MDGSRLSGGRLRQRRRWSFAGCIFDESNWALIVDGQRVSVEAKPLELLRELLLCAGNLVSKEELLDIIWPDVEVVEASLPTAVAKLRRALCDDQREMRIIETVPRIGYRFVAPVEMQELPEAPMASIAAVRASAEQEENVPTVVLAVGKRSMMGHPRHLSVWGGFAIAVVVIAITLATSQDVFATRAARPFSQRDAATALRNLDVGSIDRMLSAGWNPNTAFDDEGNGAINIALNICEWDREHDRSQLLLVVRTLIDGGAKLDRRNVWGDTPYSIAKAQRYCGPNHPVTNSIRTICYAGYQPLGDRCLASYEIARRVG